MNSRSLVWILMMAAVVHARPSPQSDSDQSDVFGVTDALGRATGIGATLFSSVMTTGRAIGEQLSGMASDALTSATQAVLGVNNAVRETTVNALEGTRQALGSGGEFIGDSIRSTGRFAADVFRNGFQTTRDATSAAGQLVAGVSSSALQSGISTAESAGDFARSAFESVGTLANTAGESAGRVLVSGIENFSDPGRF
ncbi:uncharacterized protein [Palaemon carinicauda]|uniref:uncharacterized protein n=1 Tax=Palaemon carinicauda TaxID=392227 RepID=UPI0035B60F4A